MSARDTENTPDLSRFGLVTTTVLDCFQRGQAERKSSLFLYCRIIRAQRFLTTDPKTQRRKPATSEEIADHLEHLFAQYLKAGRFSLGQDFWEAQFPEYDGREEFLVTLEQVRVPEGTSLLEVALERAQALPLQTIVRHSPGYRRFVSIAGHLQRARRPGQTIQLPVEKFGKLLAVDPKMISQYRKWAIEEAILRQVRKHNSAAGLAAEFIFDVDKFDWHTGRQRSDRVEGELQP
jgi:hypothetical protein